MNNTEILKKLFDLSKIVEDAGKEIGTITAGLLGQEWANLWLNSSSQHSEKTNINNLISQTKYLDMATTPKEEKEIEEMPYLKEGTIRKRNDGRWETRAMIDGKQRTTATNRVQAACIKNTMKF